MKREIRFRAWLPNHRKMTHEHDLDELLGWDIKGEHKGTAIWLQFTGLHDKNGLEIYEGDVVKCHDHPTGVEDGIFQVEFLEGAFRTGRIILGDWGTAWIEVIGSIFTHPELIQTIK